MIFLRTALAVVVITAASYAVRELAYAPFECNRAEKRAELATTWANQRSASLVGTGVARETAERMQHCIRSCPTSIDAYMVAGADYWILERIPEAIATYQSALRYDRRPEIYFELGLAYLQAGQRERATSTLFVWNLFYAQQTDVIPDPGVRADVEARTKRFFEQGKNAQRPTALRSDR